jgi:hypothetical protein
MFHLLQDNEGREKRVLPMQSKSPQVCRLFRVCVFSMAALDVLGGVMGKAHVNSF